MKIQIHNSLVDFNSNWITMWDNFEITSSMTGRMTSYLPSGKKIRYEFVVGTKFGRKGFYFLTNASICDTIGNESEEETFVYSYDLKRMFRGFGLESI